MLMQEKKIFNNALVMISDHDEASSVMRHVAALPKLTRLRGATQWTRLGGARWPQINGSGPL